MNFLRLAKVVFCIMLAFGIVNGMMATIPGFPTMNTYSSFLPSLPSSFTSTGTGGIITDATYLVEALWIGAEAFLSATLLVPLVLAEVLGPLGLGFLGAAIGMAFWVTYAIGIAQWFSGRYGVFVE